jgi:glycosyltransferase involved in cell wall biosynthesis
LEGNLGGEAELMTRPRELICFGEDWDRHPSTAQFLVQHLLDSFRVIWFNSLGWRTPRINSRDLIRAFGKLRTAAQGVQRPHPNLTVYTPLVVPWYRSAAVRRLNAGLLQRAVHSLAQRHGFSRYTLMTTFPAPEELFRRMRGVRRVYYCADEYTTFPDLQPQLVQALEQSLLEAVDVVVTTSKPLYDAKLSRHPHVVYLPHGVDVNHFAKAADPATPVPDDLKRLPRPIIGFHGLLRELIDFEIIDTIARRRANWSVVLVGPRNFDTVALPQRHNLHYLGERPYNEIPHYLRGFDVCIIPYRISSGSYVNPVKFREYLAAGKPIVATPLPEVLQFEELVQIAVTGDEFVERIKQCLSEDPALPERRMASMRGQAWPSRAAELAAIL